MKKIILIAILAVAGFAQAQTLSNLMMAPPVDAPPSHGGNGGPPISAPGTLRFSELKTYWDRGVAVTQNELVGSWKRIAVATTSNCAYLDQDRLNPDGINNNDGSIKSLMFDLSSRGLPGTPSTDILTVSLLHLGTSSANQGPFEVMPLEPQFSQWGYYNGVLSQESYFEYNCRFVAKASAPKQLICAISAKLRDPNRFGPGSVMCSLDPFAMIEVFYEMPH